MIPTADGEKRAPTPSEQLAALDEQCPIVFSIFVPAVSIYTFMIPVVSKVEQSVQNKISPGTSVWQLVPVYPVGHTHTPLLHPPPFWHTTPVQLRLLLPPPPLLPPEPEVLVHPHKNNTPTTTKATHINLFITPVFPLKITKLFTKRNLLPRLWHYYLL